MSRRNVRKQKVGFPLFSPDSDDRMSLFSHVCYFIYKLGYTKCEHLDNTVYRCCAIALTVYLAQGLKQPGLVYSAQPPSHF